MDGISTAASVIAVIQLTAGIINICGRYLQGVRNAKDDISSLQQAVISLEGTLLSFKELSSFRVQAASTFPRYKYYMVTLQIATWCLFH